MTLQLLTLLFVGVAIAAPAPKDTVRPTAAGLRLAIGKSVQSKEVRVVGRALGEDPVAHFPHWEQDAPENGEGTSFRLRWKAKGLDLWFDRGNLHTAWMYNDKILAFKRYVGELPENLSFDDGSAEVEKKLGKPEVVLRTPPEDEPGKKAAVKTDYIYKKKGVCVSFRKAAEGNDTIEGIAIFPPGDAPSWE